jgi:hypothetical protein
MALNEWLPSQPEEPSLMAKVASRIAKAIPGVSSIAGMVNDVVNYDPVKARMEGSVTNLPVESTPREPVSKVLRPEVSRAVESAIRNNAAVAPNLLRQNTAIGDAARSALARMRDEPETVQSLYDKPQATITNSSFERKGVADIPIEALGGAVERLASTAVGATRAGADLLGIDAPVLNEEARRLSDQYYNRFAQFDNELRPYATGVSQFIEQAPTIALAAPWRAAATGGEAITRAAASMIPFAGSVGLPIYAEERAAGEAPLDAAQYAIEQTGAEVIPEVLSLGAMLRMPLPQFSQIARANPRAVVDAIKYAGSNLGAQIADEEASTLLGFMVDRANDRPGATVQDLLPQLADTVKSSAAMSALFMGLQGAGYGVSRRRQQQPMERDITDETIEIPQISEDWLPQTEAAGAAPQFDIPSPDADEIVARPAAQVQNDIPSPDGDDNVAADIEIPQAEPEGLQQPSGVRGGAGALETDGGQEPRDGEVRQEPRYKPLEGLPARVKVGEQEVEYGPIDQVHDTAKAYVESRGDTYQPLKKYRKVDPERATRIATEFERMEHKPDDPEVKRAYRAMIDETLEQYRAMERSGVKIEFIPEGSPDPYVNPRAAIDDIKNNNHLYVFSTKAGFGSDVEFDASQNPMLEESGIQFNGQPALVNDVFRAVHDYFGHAKDGVGFRADGEENAWRSHARMYSPLARRAMTTETRGQNSWVNYGPAGQRNRTASPEDTIYADQKVGLLPEWVSQEGADDEDTVPVNQEGAASLRPEPTQGERDQTQPSSRPNRENAPQAQETRDTAFAAKDATESTPNKKFLAELREGTSANPFNDRELLIEQDALVEVYDFNGKIDVRSIRSIAPGGGRKAINLLTKLADKHGVTMTLYPKKYGDKGLSTAELKKWYARNGFKKSGQDMVREPAKKDTAVAAKSREYTFSKLERTIQSKMANQEPASALRDKLVGWTNKGDFSADELKFSGLADWLDEQPGKVTKEQVMDFLAMNNVEVEEELLSAKVWDKKKNYSSKYMLPAVDTALEGATMETPEAMAITLANDYAAVQALSKKYPDLMEEDGWAEKVVRDIYGDIKPRVRYGDAKLQLPGGENYKEILLKLPASSGKDYEGSHYKGTKNILAHIRFDERTDAEGGRVLFIEEIQSDWAQQGKRKGFGQAAAQPLAEGEWKAFMDRARSVAADEMQSRLGDSGTREDVENIAAGMSNEDVVRMAESREPAIRQEWDNINERQNAFFQQERQGGPVPSAPFVGKTDAWVGLALKRMVRYAAENGFDRIAWTTGEQQADRYDLSKQINSIKAQRVGRYYDLELTLNSGSKEQMNGIEDDELQDNVGKDLAEKIVADLSGEAKSKSYSGLDLKVGGTGMRVFYDQIVPKVAKDVIKRIGGDGVKVIRMDARNVTTKALREAYEDVTGSSLSDWSDPESALEDMKEAYQKGDAEFKSMLMDGMGLDDADADMVASMTYRFMGEEAGTKNTQLGFDITPKMRQMAMSGEQAIMAKSVYEDFAISDATTVFETGAVPSNLHGYVESKFDDGYYDTFANALADVVGGGMPKEVVDMVKGWTMHSPNQEASAKAYLVERVISVRKDIVRSAKAGDKKAMGKLRWAIAHELGHIMDGNTSSIEDMLSANAARFAIDLSDPNDIIAGDIAEEAMLHYAGGGELTNYLAYPLDDAAASIDDPAFLQTELFAQLNALYIANPEAMKRNLPLAYEMYEGIYGKTEDESATWEQVNSRLQDALSETSAEGIGAGRVSRRDVARRTAETTGQGGGDRGGDTGLDARQGRPRNSLDWDETDPTLWEKVRRAVQDKQIDVRAVQDSLEDALGTSLNENADVYLADDNYYGRQSARVEQFRNQVVKPLVEAMSKAGISIDDVGRFLWARHAPERNRQMARINGGQQGLSGLTNAQAKEIIEDFKLAGKLEKLGKVAGVIDKINAQRRKLLVDSGLLTMAEADAWTDTYKYYVPLMRDMESTMSRGKGFSVSGPESKRAMGSKKAAVGILENVFAQYETTITRAEKNKVAKALYDLAKEYPNEDFWQVDIVPVKKGIDPNSGLVTLYNDPSHKRLDNVVVVKIDGKEHTITFNADNERALAMAKAIKNLDAVQLHAVLQTFGSVTRFLASMLTTYNPAFWMTNFQRDAQTALVNLQNTALNGKGPAVMKNVPQAMRGIWRGVSGKFDTPWSKHYREFELAGGKTGWSQIFEDVRARNKDLAKAMERATRSDFDPREVANKFLESVRNLNDAVENSIRLSAYVEARKIGLSEAKAAALAKNLTVNFNRKGNQAWINALYMFFNANVQGTARLAQALVQSRKAQAIVASMVLFSFINDMFNRWVDEDAWETLDENVKRRNLIFLTGEGTNKYVSIPLPYGYDVFHNAGRKISEAFFSPNFDPLQAATDYLITVVDAFSPLGQSGSLAQYISPTMLDPFVQVSENKSSFGSPVMPEQSQFSVKPDYQRYWSSTPSTFVETAKTLSDITGGDEVQGGSVDVSPETLQLVFDTVTGGVGRLATQLVEAGTRLSTGRPVKISQTPFLNRNAGEIDDRKVAQRFYKIRDEVKKFDSDIAAYRKAGKFDKVREHKAENPGLVAASRALKANKIRQKNLSRDRKELVNMGYGEKLDARDSLEARQADIARKVIEAYNKGNAEK